MSDHDIEVRTYFARGRNALVARATFSEIFAAWYLHRMDCGLHLPAELDPFARDALSALTLHCASRPWRETCAWTVHFPHPRANVFASGDNAAGTVVANVFFENIRDVESGVFYADVIEDGGRPRRSSVSFEGSDFLSAVEQYYRQSEQRPARFFRYGDEDLVMVSAQPDCDLPWLESLDDEAVRQLDQTVELSLLETRPYRFHCGCTQEKMLDFLKPVFQRQGEDLFGGEETLRIHCPRCGARHTITREALEAHSG